MLNFMHTTQDTKKNGDHLNVRLEKKTAFFTGFFVSGNHFKILQFGGTKLLMIEKCV